MTTAAAKITPQQLNATFEDDEVDFRDFLKELETVKMSSSNQPKKEARKESPTNTTTNNIKKSTTTPSVSPSESMMQSPSPSGDKSRAFRDVLKQTMNRKGFMKFLQRGNLKI